MRQIPATALALGLILWAGFTPAQTTPSDPAPADMTPPRLAAILLALDPQAVPMGNGALLTLEGVPVRVIMDAGADRMRAMVPIRAIEGMTPDELSRVLYANFDTALDARYALSDGKLWAVYIHPLSPLRADQLISGLGQTVNLALTYGTDYSGGLFTYGGEGSEARRLIDELLERGQDL